MRGLVLTGSNNFFTIKCEDGQIRRCNIKGKILQQDFRSHNPLAPGDYVKVEVDKHDKTEAQVLELIKRKNFFARHNEKTASPQILASNIDLVLCLTSPDTPRFHPIFVDRVLVQASSQNISVIIVVNKIDIPKNEKVKSRIYDWKKIGYKVLELSTFEKVGIQELAEAINGKTVCLIGQSGVGKSSLINSLSSKLNLPSGEVSKKYNKGSHTTTCGTLYEIENTDFLKNFNAQVIDTPGIKNFSLYGIEANEVALYFPELSETLGKCKFGLSCSHQSEQGCAIRQRLDDGKISEQRYESWLNMVQSQK